ncbi:murein biosynthesis integral membrane protein MurJ [Rhodobacter sp. TJ_12]|uniref:murein biosynthesis integral membrane protein MurJ n=1 Tax=Rhodobacter sp. TJ_12 TaxID=2029399 RepID=UPI001CC0BB30|nr:murein biosynthesis integral membrane protein MurJ [Rhodobacter sp. TJ_12]MBZ4022741.1 murein biosynthesis integral membrane protein MurJ [Rhodobacter sp. TJ_12]
MTPIRLVRGFFTVGGWTMASRILGFVRDAWIAAVLGTGPAAQAFIVAFSLPNMFRRFFAEGAFNTAFVPMFSKKLEGGAGAEDFAREALAGLASVVLALTLIAQLFMPGLVYAMASGFSGEKFDLTVTFARIAFPYILFISLAALASGVLNATGRFAAAAAAPVLLNVVFLATLWAAPRLGLDPGLALTWAVPVAGIAQFALVWEAARRAGVRLVPRPPRLSPDMKRLAMVAAPAMLAGGVVQINLLVGRQVSSYFDEAVAWLYNADRLYQLPLGVVAIAIGVVLLPDLSRRLQNGDAAGARHSFNRATEFCLALTLPAAVALMVIAEPLTSVLFERGRFGPEDTAATAVAVAVYGVGLPAFVLQKVLQPLFFAREDTRSPFRYALVAMVVNAVLAVGLAFWVGYIAAALATTLAAWVMVVQLWLGSRAMGDSVMLDEGLRKRAPRIAIASAVMGLCLWLGNLYLGPALHLASWRYLALAGLIGIGIVSYFGSGAVIGAFRLSDFKSAVRRGR